MSDRPLQDAQNKFSERVRRAQAEGPQTVTVHGKTAAMMFVGGRGLRPRLT